MYYSFHLGDTMLTKIKISIMPELATSSVDYPPTSITGTFSMITESYEFAM